MAGKIWFYSTTGEYGYMSNFSRHAIKIGTHTYQTTEHYFQSQKYKGTPWEKKVREAKSPKEAARIGRNKKGPLRKDWESIKDSVMRQAVLAKFMQHQNLAISLLATSDSHLIEDTSDDDYWGCGDNNTGKNMLGIILMEVRKTLKSELVYDRSR